MEELSWDEYKRRIEAGAILFLPCGALEQHGYHLPLGTDVTIPLCLALRLAPQVNGIVAPPLSYGYKSQPLSGGGQHFPGTTSLDGQTLTWLTRDVLKEFMRHGATRIVLLQGHMENTFFLIEGIDLARRESAAYTGKILLIEWWQLLSSPTLDQVFDQNFPGWELEHAALVETALMMYFRPELVQTEKITAEKVEHPLPYHLFPYPPDMVTPSGSLSPAHRASREKGEALVEEIVAAALAILQREFGEDTAS
ncbi:MAG: creatininase [Nitrospinota bacterium]|nr:MAG: creatininase [Nitrospinota bacterium]